MGGLFSLCFDSDNSISDRERTPLIPIHDLAREMRELRNFITDDRRRLENIETIISKTQTEISKYKKDKNNKDFDTNNRITYLEKRFSAISDALGPPSTTFEEEDNARSMID
jgi:hypothetical protein